MHLHQCLAHNLQLHPNAIHSVTPYRRDASLLDLHQCLARNLQLHPNTIHFVTPYCRDASLLDLHSPQAVANHHSIQRCIVAGPSSMACTQSQIASKHNSFSPQFRFDEQKQQTLKLFPQLFAKVVDDQDSSGESGSE